MPPVVAAIGALITTASIGAATAAFALAGGWTALGIWALSTVISFGLSKLLAPSMKSKDRQADVTTMDVGENPREVAIGQVATGGQLVDCWNHSQGSGRASKNRAEVLVIKLSDVPVDSIVGYYVNDDYYAWSADGDQAAFTVDGFNYLQIYFRRGAPGQTPPSDIVSTSGGKWTSAKTMTGCAHILVRYMDHDNRYVFPQGRPRFLWVIKGARLYDPRKDSSVPGGSGSHVWGDPTTYEWSANAYLGRYNYTRGFFNGSQLMVGRGLTDIEAPPERAIARANTCDENVTLRAGGTEKRYTAHAVIKSSETAIEVEEAFAAAMGGNIVDRDGVVDIDPGEAKSSVFDITDGDLVRGEAQTYTPELTDDLRVNTVVPRYVDPAKMYEGVGGVMRRDYADVLADGKPYELSPDLIFVHSQTQAQRIAEIRRREGRLERSWQLILPPRFIGIEVGDWGTINSDRYTGGEDVDVTVVAVAHDAMWRVIVGLREVSANTYAWTPATDELLPTDIPALSTPDPADILVTSFAASASVTLDGIPAVLCTWADFEDPAARGIIIQIRRDGETNLTSTTINDPVAVSTLVTNGVGATMTMNVRARAIAGTPGRNCPWTSWVNVTTGELDATTLGGVSAATILANIAAAINDGKLTPREKYGLVPDIKALLASQSALGTRATALGITTEKTAFDTAITTLTTHLATLTTPVLWDSYTGDTAVTSTLGTYLRDAYEKRDALTAKIDELNANALLPVSTNNLVRYSEMQKGTAGYVIDNTDAFTSVAQTSGVTSGKAWVKVTATCPATNKAITMRQITADAFACSANQKLSCEVEFEATGTVNYVYALLFFYNAADGLVTVQTIQLKSTPLTFGTKLSSAAYVVPNNTGIVKATVAIVANCNAGAMSLTLTRPLAATRASDVSPVPPYAPGPNNQPNADVTAINVAASVSGQADWATYTGVSTGLMRQHAQASAFPNLMRNPHGRLGAGYWTLVSGTPLTSFFPGGASADQDNNAAFAAASGSTEMYQDVAIRPGTAYSFNALIAAWAYTSGSLELAFEWRPSGTALAVPNRTLSSASSVSPFLQNFVAPVGATHLRITIKRNSWVGDGGFYNMKLNYGPVSTALNNADGDTTAYTDAIVDQNTVIGRAGLVTSIGTAAAIAGQKSGATTQITAASSAPGSPSTGDWWLDTTTTVPIWKRWSGAAWVATNPDSAYLNASGQIIDYRGLPANATGPYGITRSLANVIGVTIPTTQITILSHTVYAPGGSISVTGGTITGLTAGVVYDCFWRLSNSTLSALQAGTTAANQRRADPDYLWLATGEPGAAANEAAGMDRLSVGNYV